MYKKIIALYALYSFAACFGMEPSKPNDGDERQIAELAPAYQAPINETPCPFAANEAALAVACTICRSNHITGAQIILPCRHSFCETCINRLRDANNGSAVCPLCRGTVPPAIIVETAYHNPPTPVLAVPVRQDEDVSCCALIMGTEDSPFKVLRGDNRCTVLGKAAGNCCCFFCVVPTCYLCCKASAACYQALGFTIQNCCFCPGCCEEPDFHRTAFLCCCCVNEPSSAGLCGRTDRAAACASCLVVSGISYIAICL